MDKKFTCTYSTAQREEVERIRGKYSPAEQADRMERLRKLDRSATRPGMITSLLIGTLSTLVLGTGMCCIMLWADTLFALGVAAGIVGLAGVCAACPIYARITRRQRDKVASEIARLSDELLNELPQ